MAWIYSLVKRTTGPTTTGKSLYLITARVVIFPPIVKEPHQYSHPFAIYRTNSRWKKLKIYSSQVAVGCLLLCSSAM